MKPVSFSCTDTLPQPPEAIADQILDVDRWKDFHGYGPLPGIRSAEFTLRTPQVVGSRIRVTNTDGSTHTEEIVEWNPATRLRLDMVDFSPPLSRLATRFEEAWTFERVAVGTRVVRSFTLHPRSAAARPVLWLISLLLRRAIARNLAEIRTGYVATTE
ncbi:SRPBCC family protein [Planctomyces sp. SH-PL14]|uniref:SRPBCC family protein n=1 Tax=Planctomyces sp. SH-PL14 TaxID=1632864 RepID=UPI00078C169D|nr:SRPBCC family protein [Planctomyces sp. SH-PL14]AMV20749.1 Polyketide cyclase / dehydrase and lipid transport [Planctomyces sp. SH-PL14]